jgi:predicted amidophosphoribosyltransferase
MSNPESICAICLSAIAAGEAKTICPACQAGFHLECWQENGGCAVYGCSQVPATEQRRAIETPVSYWGQENKNCPQCGREILAAAVRCRHCGTTFESARPQNTEEFQQQTAVSQRLPAARRTVIGLFICSVLPFLAPVGAVCGWFWLPAHREELRALPSIYGALGKIGLALASGQTLLLVVLALLYTFVHH